LTAPNNNGGNLCSNESYFDLLISGKVRIGKILKSLKNGIYYSNFYLPFPGYYEIYCRLVIFDFKPGKFDFECDKEKWPLKSYQLLNSTIHNGSQEFLVKDSPQWKLARTKAGLDLIEKVEKTLPIADKDDEIDLATVKPLPNCTSQKLKGFIEGYRIKRVWYPYDCYLPNMQIIPPLIQTPRKWIMIYGDSNSRNLIWNFVSIRAKYIISAKGNFFLAYDENLIVTLNFYFYDDLFRVSLRSALKETLHQYINKIDDPKAHNLALQLPDLQKPDFVMLSMGTHTCFAITLNATQIFLEQWSHWVTEYIKQQRFIFLLTSATDAHKMPQRDDLRYQDLCQNNYRFLELNQNLITAVHLLAKKFYSSIPIIDRFTPYLDIAISGNMHNAAHFEIGDYRSDWRLIFLYLID